MTKRGSTNLDNTQIKLGIVKGILDDMASGYCVPQSLPWVDNYSRIMHNLVYSLAVGNTGIITELVEFNAKVQRSQKYLFQIDPTSDCLIDTR